MIAEETALDTGILILRLVLGLTLAAHGYAKFFSGDRLAGVAGWFHSIGMKQSKLSAAAAATTELGAGIALAAGLFMPLAGAAFVALMVVASWTAHRGKGFFITSGGWEYNFVLAGSAVAAATIGAGKFSLDNVLFSDTWLTNVLHGWWALLIAVAVGLIGATGQLVLFFRRPANNAR